MARLGTFGFENPLELLLWDNSTYPEYIGIREDKTAYSGLHVVSFISNSTYMDFGVNNKTEIYMGFAHRYNGAPTSGADFLKVSNTVGNYNNYLSVRLAGASSTISVTRNGTVLATSAGGVTPAVGTWMYVEAWFKPLNTSGRIVVKIDGTSQIDFTGDTTNDQEYITSIRLQAPGNSTTYDFQFDDIVINDSSGSYNNSYPGVIHLLQALPSSAGDNTDFTRAGVDMGANYAQISSNDTDSWLEGTAEQYDLYTTPSPDLPVGATIKNIVVISQGRSTAGTSYVQNLVKDVTTESGSPSLTLGTDWTIRSTAFPINPYTASGWADTDFPIQVGMRVKSS